MSKSRYSALLVLTRKQGHTSSPFSSLHALLGTVDLPIRQIRLGQGKNVKRKVDKSRRTGITTESG